MDVHYSIKTRAADVVEPGVGPVIGHNEIFQTLTFGREGAAEAETLFGWSQPEDGYTWTDGKVAGIRLRNPVSEHGFYVEIFGWPNTLGGLLHGQMVHISINDYACGTAVVSERSRHAWYVPRQPNGPYVYMQLQLPDAAAPNNPNDTRVLGFAVQSIRTFLARVTPRYTGRLAALPLALTKDIAVQTAERLTNSNKRDLSVMFESLGANCELGFFQRECGAEPLGLLRFSGALTHSLVLGLDEKFDLLGDETKIDPHPEETNLRDWVIYEQRYNLRYHSWILLDQATRAEMVLRESKRLKFLRDKFINDIREGDKVFVHQDRRSIELAEILPLFLALRRIGPCSLIWICPEDEDHPAGRLQEVYPGLYQSWFSHFIHQPSGQLSLSDWLALATNAFLLIK